VLYDDGSPAADAFVEIVNPDPAASDVPPNRRTGTPTGPLPPPSRLGSTNTLEDGSFEVARLPAAPWRVIASTGRQPQPDLAYVTYRATRDVFEDVADLVLELAQDPRSNSRQKARELAGRVRDAETSAPILAFEVDLVSANRHAGGSPQSAPGEFRIADPPKGSWTLRVTADGYARADQPIEITDDASPAPVDVALERGHVVRGTVRGPDGVDVARSTLEFRAEGEYWNGPRTAVRSDGTYELRVAELHRAVPSLLTHLATQQRELAHLTSHSATLEDVFVSLTGRQLRDD